MLCGSGILAPTSRSFRNKSNSSIFEKMPQTVGEGAGSIHPNNFAPSLASELHQQKKKRTIRRLRKGLFLTMKANIVRPGTEPNRLIATAAGLEAFIPNGDAASFKAE
jgi:hypothetical protein